MWTKRPTPTGSDKSDIWYILGGSGNYVTHRNKGVGVGKFGHIVTKGTNRTPTPEGGRTKRTFRTYVDKWGRGRNKTDISDISPNSDIVDIGHTDHPIGL